MWNTIIYVIVKETFWNCYVNVAKKYFLTLSFYSTFSEYSYNKAHPMIERRMPGAKWKEWT